MDLQLFADGGEAAAPALSAAQEQQAVASGTLKPGEKADAKQETTAPEGEKEVKETEPVKAEEGQEQEPPRPALPERFPGSQAVDALHRRWAAEEAMMRRAVPEFSLQKELADLHDEFAAKKAQWENEKASVDKLSALREEIESINRQIQDAKQKYDLK